jgi:hypothetical protein
MSSRPDNQEATDIFMWCAKRNKGTFLLLTVLGILSGGFGLLAFPVIWLFIRSGIRRDHEDSVVYEYRHA